MAKRKSKAELVQEIFAEAGKEEIASLYAIASYWARKAGLLSRKPKAAKVIGQKAGALVERASA